jgi:hypothetical protein
MTTLEQIQNDPQEAYYNLITNKELNEQFKKIANEYLKHINGPFNTLDYLEANKYALSTMIINGALK